MKRIGILGGMSWESTATYYRLLNQGVRDRLGGLHSADLVVRSFDFATIEALQAEGDWDAAGGLLAEAAADLERIGAEAIVIATNTMHLLAPVIEARTHAPLLHIGDATADALLAAGRKRPLLLATRYTMEQDFLRGRLRAGGDRSDGARREGVPGRARRDLQRAVPRRRARGEPVSFRRHRGRGEAERRG